MEKAYACMMIDFKHGVVLVRCVDDEMNPRPDLAFKIWCLMKKHLLIKY